MTTSQTYINSNRKVNYDQITRFETKCFFTD